MKLKLFHLVALLSLASLLLSACATQADPNYLMCPQNPAAETDPRCVPDTNNHVPPVGMVRVPKAFIDDGVIGIGVPYKSDAPYTLLATKGLQEGWAATQVSKIPLTHQELRTDSNPEGKFCKEEKAPMCLGLINGQFQFEKDGKVQLVNYELSFIAGFDTVVNPETVALWGSIDRTKKTTWEMFASNFHDVFRGEKLLNLGKFDPIADLGADTTRSLVVKIYEARIKAWKYAPLVKDVKIIIKDLKLPGITDAPAANNTGGGAPTISNDSVAAAQREIKVLDAQSYRKQAEAICGVDQVLTQACVDHMRNFLGLVPPASFPIQPTASPNAVPTKKP